MDEINYNGEVWKNVVGWEGLYEVSNMGRVRNAQKHIMIAQKCRKGYMRISLRKSPRSESHSVHRLVTKTFIGDPPFPEAEVNHKNGVKDANFVENLEWLSSEDNMKHARNLPSWGNKASKGNKNGNSKLTESQVIRLRERHSMGVSYKELMKEFSCGKSMIGYIINRTNWTHI